MSSTIKLYEHNQKAYDALLDMLGERDRACVIKPTGTGKFVIIAKMVQDNPDKRFLLLGTNDYMFNDQMANLAEIAPGFTPENLQFMTYAAAMGMERRNDCVPPYDVIIADEFHHCGAEEWGKGVTHILNANESAKVVGFTATPIRYSDGGRNMVDLNLIPRSLERTKSIGSFAKSAGEVIRRGQLLRENRFALNVSIRLAGVRNERSFVSKREPCTKVSLLPEGQ